MASKTKFHLLFQILFRVKKLDPPVVRIAKINNACNKHIGLQF